MKCHPRRVLFFRFRDTVLIGIIQQVGRVVASVVTLDPRPDSTRFFTPPVPGGLFTDPYAQNHRPYDDVVSLGALRFTTKRAKLA